MKFFTRCKLVLLLSWLLAIPAWAQTQAISGRVSGSDGGGLPGATILEQGTTNGVSTNSDGAFTFSVKPNATLVISSVGYITQTIPVGSRATFNVTLTASATELAEAVVVGYGTQTKQDLTGSIATVGSKEINNVPVLTFEQAIQGKAAGVFIESGGGKLGQATKVRVRGTTSVSGDNQPLYVVDGIPVINDDLSGNGAPTNPLTDLNPNDIENISILKDASASAIYGSRASNGVILITTKRGKSGATHFELGYQTGVSDPTRNRKFLNATDYVALVRESANNTDDILGIPRTDPNGYTAYAESKLQSLSGGNDDYKTGLVNTDWQKELQQRRAATNQYSLSASGGDEKTRFYLAGNYIKQNGIIRNNNFERINTRINIDHKATTKLVLGLNLNLSRTLNNRIDNDNSFGTAYQAVALSPITPVIDPRTGLASGAFNPATGLPNTTFPLYYNPLLSLDNVRNATTVYRTLGNVYAAYDLAKGLTFRSELGIDLLFQTEDYKAGLLTARNTGFTVNGSGYNTTARNTRFTTNNYFTYRPTLGEKNSLEVVAGTAYEERRLDANSVSGQQFPSDAYRLINAAAVISGGSSSSSRSALLSYFGRANYAFDNKYLLTLSGRVDGSSRFSNRYGFFPAASVGWLLTEENFLKNQKILSTLKPRVSIGQTGNQQGFPDNAYTAQYSAGAYGGIATQRPASIANDNLKWETTTQTDAGIDFGFLDGRISGEVDVYQKKTKGLVLNTNLPGITGFTTYFQNVGDMENKGLEFLLTTRNALGAFTWTTSFNAATNINKVTNLGGQVINGGYINRAVEGQPIGVFYAQEFAGADPMNGDALYWKNRTITDGSTVTTVIDHSTGTTNDYNTAARVVLGNPNPRWTGGVTNTLGYKGIELNFTFQGVFGNSIYNGAGQYESVGFGNGLDNQTTDQLDRWQKPGDITNVPQARLFLGNGISNSSRFLSHGDYVRLKTTTLSYTFPTSLLGPAHISNARLFLTGVNLLTFTKYNGADPEVNADYIAGNIGQGNDFYSAPQLRTYTLGVILGF
ncbi:SusC/RagA family TonB-linked outer membrane protein [Hymenobacter caeli]|uniref:TonB-linked SusC/RagA family outer membrane protein n=1 Tax=Hymenobacter caeli TaxID=2735894 RepID=A0ABX2FPG3_9BACT|nr:TonB-dependent receptor [Hymenobacter caeli]NRT19066.1 TonB-linked SusC/RagA family outer membrane protein [Hymenobacter caeli]